MPRFARYIAFTSIRIPLYILKIGCNTFLLCLSPNVSKAWQWVAGFRGHLAFVHQCKSPLTRPASTRDPNPEPIPDLIRNAAERHGPSPVTAPRTMAPLAHPFWLLSRRIPLSALKRHHKPAQWHRLGFPISCFEFRISCFELRISAFLPDMIYTSPNFVAPFEVDFKNSLPGRPHNRTW
jgi:hypothetical protein